ncbi:hypothetical protein [Pseudomonas nitroreducens]|uniref:hypothetical protein n=1 Tax=Pseudomonas nitroreducens TaxID=46680 RepID=UPI002FE2A20C
MNTLPSKEEVFRCTVERKGDALNAAGIGLAGIGLMLAEGELSTEEANALHHAVIALGAMVAGVGGDLYNAAEEMRGSE